MDVEIETEEIYVTGPRDVTSLVMLRGKLVRVALRIAVVNAAVMNVV